MIRVLHYVGYPLGWAPGGHALQIRETLAGMREFGVEHTWLHHEADDYPEADLLHYWGRPPHDQHWRLARARGLKLVISEYHQQGVLRPRWTWPLRGQARLWLRRMGGGIYSSLGAEIYPQVDAAIAATPYEARYMRVVFGSPAGKTHVVPNGVSDVFFDGSIEPVPFEGLVYSAYISRRKNCLEVARAARRNRIPVKFVGGVSEEDSRYVAAFRNEVDNETVFWTGELQSPEAIAAQLRGAKGLVLASRNEAVGISALEAMACGRPVLVSRLPNLVDYYRDAVEYCAPGHEAGFGRDLRAFWERCYAGTAQNGPFDLWRWRDVSRAVYDLYGKIL